MIRNDGEGGVGGWLWGSEPIAAGCCSPGHGGGIRHPNGPRLCRQRPPYPSLTGTVCVPAMDCVLASEPGCSAWLCAGV